ncbi:hypothetical protein VII00023_22944 [Vibrio ichthyoenteri ATCC 700023]|uniref:Uncharacterized protein n=1 Tax=Vibrio ichthyoenteri ATCC 700023 TaxID=870968 RepID=F9S7J4_9VIBR|nr:hypothetical protein [Vibrio ichthyoenteri]EGU31290.1 hypothetical protein VII00023_22944 [Vibrio ichthyoenteri ATCC 700023]
MNEDEILKQIGRNYLEIQKSEGKNKHLHTHIHIIHVISDESIHLIDFLVSPLLISTINTMIENKTLLEISITPDDDGSFQETIIEEPTTENEDEDWYVSCHWYKVNPEYSIGN